MRPAALTALLVLAPFAVAADLPPHPPLRVLIVSDEVNPHGLSSAELTEPGDIGAALSMPGAGLNLDPAPDAVLEVPTDDIHLATAALSVPPGDPAAYDVVVYFAHRIPADDTPTNNQADQDAFVAALEAHLVAGGGVIGFHHGNYTAPGKAGVLDLLGATASSVAWNTSVGQDVIAVGQHFISTNGVDTTGTRSYADPAFGVPLDDYPVFTNLPDERYPAFSINPSAGEITPLFASDYVQAGATHVLGFVHRRPAWAGAVVVYQPGEHQPQALDDLDGNNFQILANAIVWSANVCATDASWSAYGAGTAGTLGVPALTLSGDPELGVSFDVQVGNSLGAAQSGFLFLGFAQAALPAKGGVLLVAPPWIQIPLAVPAGGLSFPAVLPLDAALCGAVVSLQAVLFPDPGAPAGFAFSEGVELVAGG